MDLLKLFIFFVTVGSALTSGVQVRSTSSNLAALEEFIQERKQIVVPRYRQKYHISAPVGWINDPNGFSYFNGEYHMFYQFHPYSAEWGPMHWGHVKSSNLVDWVYQPTALIPEDEFDKDGCFSGSAVDNNGELTLIYTGNVNDANNNNKQIQNIAVSRDGIIFDKYKGNPVIAEGPDGDKDFRDPKVWKHGDYWYMVLGNASPDGRGRALLYKSQDLVDWLYLGILAESNGNSGSVWECPDFFELNGKYVLLLSPIGMEQSGDRYKNTDQSGYFVGSFDYETNVFSIDNDDFEELDFGHDFYAPQTMETDDGRRIVVGWMDMWGEKFNEQEDNWAGTLSLPRELTLGEDGKLRMKPIQELDQLREKLLISGLFEPETIVQYNNNQLEIIATTDTLNAENSSSIGIEFSISDSEKMHLLYDTETEKVILDRGADERYIRRVPWKASESLKWKIFMDASSIEVFCGDGEVVFSSRMYPTQAVKLRLIGASFNLEMYSLRQSVDN